MKRLMTAAVLLLMVLAGTAHAFPEFVNGGFEDNNFGGWTTSGTTSITSAGTDLRTNNALQTVAPGPGAHSARVGDEICWAVTGPEYSSIRQIETVQTTDLQDLYFAWAAVGLVPTNGGHPVVNTPWFQVEVNWYHQAGGMQVLASEQFYTGNPGAITPGWLQGLTDSGYEYGQNTGPGIWYYRPWTQYHMNLGGAGVLVGDRLEAVLTTRDCTQSGHASYAYLDGFGDTPPIPGDVPEPSTTVLLGLVMVSAATGGFLRRRKK